MANRSRRSGRGKSSRRKSAAEARIERITWFLLVVVFGVASLLDPGTIPNWAVPVAGGLILIFSGAVQYVRRFRVSPITWIAGTFMFVIAFYGFNLQPGADLLGFSLIIFALVIGFGVLTNET